MADLDQKDGQMHDDDEVGRTRRSDDLGKRLDNLNAKLGHRKTSDKTDADASKRGDGRGLAMAFRLSSEFVAGIVVGAAIGYAVDAYCGTSPWGMIVFFLLGFLAAILNVLRASGMVAESELHLHKVREIAEEKNSADNSMGNDSKKNN